MLSMLRCGLHSAHNARAASGGRAGAGRPCAVVADDAAEHGGVAQQHGQRAIRHQGTCETHDRAEHAGLRAVRRGYAARQILEQAAVAGRATRGDAQHRSAKAHRRAVHDRSLFERAGVRAQELGGEVIRALDHDIDPPHQLARVLGQEARANELDAARHSARAVQSALRRVELVLTNVGFAEQDLTVQVGAVHQVVVAQQDTASAGFGQGERDRAAEAADADDERRLVLERAALRI